MQRIIGEAAGRPASGSNAIGLNGLLRGLAAAALAACAGARHASAQPCDEVLFLTIEEVLTGDKPLDVEVADVDLDGLPDLLTSNRASHDVSLMYQRPDGGFLAPLQLMSAAGIQVNAVAVGQFDQNGLPDVLAVTDRRGAEDPAELLIKLQQAAGSFLPTLMVDAFPDALNDLVLADLDGDGLLDAAASSEFSFPQRHDLVVFWGSGFGFVADITTYPGTSISRSVAVADVNGDTLPDVILSDRGNDDVDVYLNQGARQFSAMSFGVSGPGGGEEPSPSRVDTADIDADGDLDLVVALRDARAVVALLNDGMPTPSFDEQVTLAEDVGGDWVEAGRVNADEFDDLVILDNDGDRAHLLFGLGTGEFCEIRVVEGIDAPTRCRIADIDVDGDNDVLIAAVNDVSAPQNLDVVVVLFNGADRDCNGDGIPDDDQTFERIDWNAPGGGPFHAEGSWCPIRVPGEEDVIAFDVGGAYDVLLDDDGFVRRMLVERGAPRISVPDGIAPVPSIVAGDGLDPDTGGADGDITVGARAGVPASLEIAGGTIIAGATIRRDTVHIGVARDTIGELLVTGHDSVLRANLSEILVGTLGSGTLTAEDGGRVEAQELILGTFADVPNAGFGVLEVRDGATCALDDELDVRRGEVTLRSGGVVDAPSVNVLDGELRGDGVFSSNINNRGVVRPGDPVGTMRVDNTYAQRGSDSDGVEATGRLIIDLDDPDNGPTDLLSVGVRADLAGSLTVEAAGDLSGLEPGDDPITIIEAADITGQFDVALLPGLPGGKFLRIVYDRDGDASVSLLAESLGEDLGFNGQAPDDLPVPGVPAAARLADMNADGFPDVIIAVPDDQMPQSAPGAVLVLLNGGNAPGGGWQGFTGGVRLAATGIDPSAVAVGDLDGVDGPDVVVTNRGDNSVTVLRNDGQGTLTLPETLFFNAAPAAVAIGDLNEDGRNDVAVAGSGPGDAGRLTVRLNAGGLGAGWNGLSLTLNGFDIGGLPTFVEIGELDNDSCLDLLVGSDADNGVNVLDNLGVDQGGNWDGFADPLVLATGGLPIAASVGDLDGDGLDDFVVADLEDGLLSVVLYDGQDPGDFAFRPPAEFNVGQAARSVASADFDDDGDTDIAVVADLDDGREVRLLRNDIDLGGPDGGQLQFAPSLPVPTPGNPRFVLAGEVDGLDGQDLVAITDDAESESPRGPGGASAQVTAALNLPSGCNAADLTEPFGLLDLADINAFVSAFLAGDPAADLDGNSILDLEDITAFATAFDAGCP